MRTSMIAAAALLAAMTTASAQETSNWGGLYIGGSAGYGLGSWDGHQIYTQQSLVPKVPYGSFDASSHTITGDGAIAGGQVGFNLQSGFLVYGAELDGSWAHLSGSTELFPYPHDPNRGTAFGTPGWGFGIENNWLATARGRVGIATGPVLLYATGGVALGGFSENHTVLGYGYPDLALATRDDTKVGWTAGAGVEWALSHNWSVKTEYLYMSFPGTGGIMQWAPKYGVATDGFSGDWNIHVVRMGLNYKF